MLVRREGAEPFQQDVVLGTPEAAAFVQIAQPLGQRLVGRDLQIEIQPRANAQTLAQQRVVAVAGRENLADLFGEIRGESFSVSLAGLPIS